MKVLRNLKLFSTNSNFYPMANRRTPKPLITYKYLFYIKKNGKNMVIKKLKLMLLNRTANEII
jgi:hypothetical protein